MRIGPDGKAWGGAWYGVMGTNGKWLEWCETISTLLAKYSRALSIGVYCLYALDDEGENDRQVSPLEARRILEAEQGV